MYHEIRKYNDGFEICCRYDKDRKGTYGKIYFSVSEVTGDSICKICGKVLKE